MFQYRIAGKRDSNKEVPANFSDFINLWSLESIACITLDKRLGIINDKNPDKDGIELIKVLNLIKVLLMLLINICRTSENSLSFPWNLK